MSALIFSAEPGIGVVLTDPNVLPITIGLGGWPGMTSMHAVIQGISVSSEGRYQFLNTLRNYTYVYVFGEKMGDIIFTGATVMGRYVYQGGGPCPSQGPSGISQLMGYYANYAIAQTGAPVAVQIGLVGFAGFLISFKVDIVNPESRIAQWQLHFKSIAT